MLRITDTYDLAGWRPQRMDMPLVYVVSCPCCGASPKPLACLYCDQPVFVGHCAQCGWLGYTTRPDHLWFDRFYASDWDAKGKTTTVDFERQALHPIAAFVPQVRQPPATVCDVGCGFGVALWQLQKMGYSVCGVEKSSHRANAAKKADLFAMSSLGNCTETFDIITAHHVLEHATDPNAFIAEIAEHQDEGGILYISVPNQVGEPSMGVLLFLPHLHSFTFYSLQRLAERHGYGLQQWDVHDGNIEVAFRKGNPIPAEKPDLLDPIKKLRRVERSEGKGPLLLWSGHYDGSLFCAPEEFAAWNYREKQAGRTWNRAVRAEIVEGPGRYPIEIETPYLFVK